MRRKHQDSFCALVWVLVVELFQLTFWILVLGLRAASYLVRIVAALPGRVSDQMRLEANRREAAAIEAEEAEEMPLLPPPEEEEDDAFRAYLRGRTWEKALSDEERRLFALYNRRERMAYVNEGRPGWQDTKTYRGLMWDITEAENLVMMLEDWLGITNGLTAGIEAARAREAEAE